MATNARFLTTHVGSLPRPDDLIAMMWAREDGIPVDRAAIEAFPQTKARVAADPGRKHRKAPACNAPISVRDMEAPRRDAERLKTALKAHGAAGAFLTAASPGVTAFFFRNDYSRTHEDYIFAIAEAMRHEYRAHLIPKARSRATCARDLIL